MSTMSKLEKLGSRELGKLPPEKHSKKGTATATEDRVAELEDLVDKLIAANAQKPVSKPLGEPPKLDRRVESKPPSPRPSPPSAATPAVSVRKSRPRDYSIDLPKERRDRSVL